MTKPWPSWGRPTLRGVLTLLAAGALLFALGTVAVGKQLRSGNDFPIYWQAARTLLSGGSPYDIASGLHGYVYLPFFALALVPLVILPLPAAAWLWFGVNVAMVVAAVHLVSRLVQDVRQRPLPSWAVPAAVAPLIGFFHDNLALGQANLCLLALTVAAVDGLVRGERPFRTGVFLGVAAALKMNAALLLLPVLFRGRIRPVAGFVAGLGAVLLLPLLLLGPARGIALVGEWHAKVIAPASEGTLQGSKIWDQSPHAALRRLLVDAPAFDGTRVNEASLSQGEFTRVSRVVGGGILCVYAAVWLLARHRRTGAALLADLALACCGMVQVVGFNLKAQFVVLLLPAVAAAAWVARPPPGHSTRLWRVLLVLSGGLLLASNPGLVGRAASNWTLAHSSVTVATFLLAAAVVGMRLQITPACAET